MLTQNRDYIPIFILTHRSWKCAERSPWYCSTGERSNKRRLCHCSVCAYECMHLYSVHKSLCVCTYYTLFMCTCFCVAQVPVLMMTFTTLTNMCPDIYTYLEPPKCQQIFYYRRRLWTQYIKLFEVAIAQGLIQATEKYEDWMLETHTYVVLGIHCPFAQVCSFNTSKVQ